MSKRDYPENWWLISYIMCESAGWACEHCGELFNKNRKAVEQLNSDGNPAVLTVHHINFNTFDNHWHNLLVCCAACHLHVQSKWQPGFPPPSVWAEPPQWMIIRGYAPLEQLRLFEAKVRYE